MVYKFMKIVLYLRYIEDISSMSDVLTAYPEQFKMNIHDVFLLTRS